MSNFQQQILDWNVAAGLMPAVPQMEHLLKQAALVLEEATETHDACIDEDSVEVLDGLCDVLYTALHLKNLLEGAGYDTEGAMQAVIENNKHKIQYSFEEANTLAKHLVEEGIACYTVSTGVESYAVKRFSDNKVMKAPEGIEGMSPHPKVELEQFLPIK